jgi:MFS family permease
MLTFNVSQPQFYYPYVILLFTLYGLVQILIWIFKSKDEHEMYDLNDEEKVLIKCDNFLNKGKLLKRNYMWAYLLAKASMWAKAPYTFMLFSTYHGFSLGEIGILYLIDAIFSLLSGPFTGILADTFGRKKIALLYPLNTMVVLLMRMSGNIPLAYTAQVMTGVVGNVLSTAYESWLNFEMIKIYGNHKTYIQHFRKNMFSKILFWDSVISLVVTTIGAIIYVR